MSDPTNPSLPDEALRGENDPAQQAEPQQEDKEVQQENLQEQFQEGEVEEYEYPAEEENGEQQEQEQQNNEEEHKEDEGDQNLEEGGAEHEEEHEAAGEEEQPQEGEVNEEQGGELVDENNQEGQNEEIPAEQQAQEEYPHEVQYLSDGQNLNDGVDQHYEQADQLGNEQIPEETHQDHPHHEELNEEEDYLPHQAEENQTESQIEHQYINQQIHQQLRIDDIYLTKSELYGEKIEEVNPLNAKEFSFIGLQEINELQRVSAVKSQPQSASKVHEPSVKKEQPLTTTEAEEAPPAFTVFVKKSAQQTTERPLVNQSQVSSTPKPVASIQRQKQVIEKPKQNVPQSPLKRQGTQIIKVTNKQKYVQRQTQPKSITIAKEENKSEIKKVREDKEDKEIQPPIVKKKKKKHKTHESSVPVDSRVIKIEEKRQTVRQIEKPIKQQTVQKQKLSQGLKENSAAILQPSPDRNGPTASIASSPPPPPRESQPAVAPSIPAPVILNSQEIKEPGIEDHPPLTSLIIIKQAEKERVGTTYNLFLKYNYDYDRAVSNYKRIVNSICLQLERQKNSKKKLLNLLTDYFVDYAKVNRQFHESVYKIQTIEQIPFSPNRFGNIKVELKAHFEELVFLRKSIANDSHKIDVYITTQVLPNIKKVFQTYFVGIGVEERRQIERRQHHYKREKVWRKLVSQLDKNFNRGMQGKQKDDIFANTIRFVNQEKIHRDALRNYGRGLIDLRQTYIRCQKELFDQLQYILNQFKTQSKTVYSVGRSIFDSISDITTDIQKMTKFSDICALTDLDYIKYVLQLHSKSSADDFRNKHFGMYLDLVFFDRVVGNIRDLYKGATNKIFPMEYQGDELIHTISGNLVHFNRERDEFRDKFVIRNINAKIIGQGIVEFDQVVKGIIFDDNRTIRLRLKDSDRAEELICYLNQKEEDIVIDQPVSARS